jgi:hypothetical protein
MLVVMRGCSLRASGILASRVQTLLRNDVDFSWSATAGLDDGHRKPSSSAILCPLRCQTFVWLANVAYEVQCDAARLSRL